MVCEILRVRMMAMWVRLTVESDIVMEKAEVIEYSKIEGLPQMGCVMWW